MPEKLPCPDRGVVGKVKFDRRRIYSGDGPIVVLEPARPIAADFVGIFSLSGKRWGLAPGNGLRGW